MSTHPKASQYSGADQQADNPSSEDTSNQGNGQFPFNLLQPFSADPLGWRHSSARMDASSAPSHTSGLGHPSIVTPASVGAVSPSGASAAIVGATSSPA